jgi:hypothetical protein
MAQIRVLRTTDTSNPVGDPVIRRVGRDRDLVSALMAQIRKLVGLGRSRVARP